MSENDKEIKNKVHKLMKKVIWDVIAVAIGFTVLMDDTPLIIGYWWVVPVVMILFIFMGVHVLANNLLKLARVLPKYIKLMDIDKTEDDE